MSDLPKLGFIGIGLMGKPMTLRLLAAGYKVARGQHTQVAAWYPFPTWVRELGLDGSGVTAVGEAGADTR